MISQNIANGLQMLANGVFVVASAQDGETHGFTATWITQASYRNPLLVLAVDKGHDTYQIIRSSGKLVINVLGSWQKDVAEHFGHSRRQPQSGYFRVENDREIPVLKECLAAIFCQVVDSLDARDHQVLLLEATDAVVFQEGTPLVFWPWHGYAEPRLSER